MSNDHNHNDLPKQPEIVPQGLEQQDAQQRWNALLERGAEPFWMQDIRCAQRRLEAQRASLRPAPSSGEPIGD